LCVFAAFGSLCFFSSRRRHTRSKRDWSSDVCSSDLQKYLISDQSPFRISWDKKHLIVNMAVLLHLSCHWVSYSTFFWQDLHHSRSEERRVGKECRSRGREEDGEAQDERGE